MEKLSHKTMASANCQTEITNGDWSLLCQ